MIHGLQYLRTPPEQILQTNGMSPGFYPVGLKTRREPEEFITLWGFIFIAARRKWMLDAGFPLWITTNHGIPSRSERINVPPNGSPAEKSSTQKVPAGMGYVGSQVGYVHFCLRTSYFSGDHVGHVLVLEPIDGENNQLHSLKVHKGRWVSWRGPLVGFPIFFISTVDFRLNGSP